MVVLPNSALDQFFLKTPCKPTTLFSEIPVIDFSDPEAKNLIVKASHEFGFFKLVNHAVPMEIMTNLENQALKFFSQAQSEKDRAGPADPFGYGCKTIGSSDDMGWVEYLLLNTSPDVIFPKTISIFQENPEIFHENPEIFRCAVKEYVCDMKKMCNEILELMADGLGMEERNVFSKLLKDEKSDSCFRINHYPPCTELEELSGGNLIGFGEHTDPQIISVLRSNNTTGLQICLRDGTWVSVPPDQTSFFINVGDTLQVMTNGRFRSVKHRVLADTSKSRVSMIYFGGPPLSEKIAPLTSLMAEDEESLYKEFTWCEYKKATYKSRLADNRLGLFEKSSG